MRFANLRIKSARAAGSSLRQGDFKSNAFWAASTAFSISFYHQKNHLQKKSINPPADIQTFVPS